MKEQHEWLEQVELKNHLGFYGRVKIHVHLKNKEKKNHIKYSRRTLYLKKEKRFKLAYQYVMRVSDI